LKSGDIEADPDVEILDSDVHLATISEGGNLNIELRLKKGRGYVSAERNFDDDLQVGYIPVDSVHSPVKKAISRWRLHALARIRILISSPSKFDEWQRQPRTFHRLAAKLIKDHMSIFINFEEEAEEPVRSRADCPDIACQRASG